MRLQKKLKGGAFDIIDGDLDNDYDEEYELDIRTKTFSFKPLNRNNKILRLRNIYKYSKCLFPEDCIQM